MSNPASSTRPRPRPSASPRRPRVEPSAEFEPGQRATTATPRTDPTYPTDPTHRADAEERLPVSELLFHRAGAASPFGDDLQFPLPAGALTYRHPRG